MLNTLYYQGFSEVGDGKQSSNISPDTGAVSLGGLDSMAGSLEDLVSTFDEKLTMCFADYEEQVEKIAPVQVEDTLPGANPWFFWGGGQNIKS